MQRRLHLGLVAAMAISCAGISATPAPPQPPRPTVGPPPEAAAPPRAPQGNRAQRRKAKRNR